MDNIGSIALGLAKHPNHGAPNLLDKFAGHVDALTYWDIYEPALDAQTTAQRLIYLIQNAEQIYFNLDGLLVADMTVIDVIEKGAMGAGEGNWTNWEFFIIITNEDFLAKTEFYLDGQLFALQDSHD